MSIILRITSDYDRDFSQNETFETPEELKKFLLEFLRSDMNNYDSDEEFMQEHPALDCFIRDWKGEKKGSTLFDCYPHGFEVIVV